MDHEACIVVDEMWPITRSSPPGQERSSETPSIHNINTISKLDRYIALVERETFVRECIHYGMQAALMLPIRTFSTISHLESQFDDSIALVCLSLTSLSETDFVDSLKMLSALDPGIPVVVLASVDNIDLARTAFNFGAKGYIPRTTNFTIAIQALRFILAGGTYFPMNYFLSSGQSNRGPTQAPPVASLLTKRELGVVRAIQEGKSNKVIAHNLGMCEGTVKVHLRNIMKKMRAKNCTDVAIKAKGLF